MGRDNRHRAETEIRHPTREDTPTVNTMTIEAPPSYCIELSSPFDITLVLQDAHNSPASPFGPTEAAKYYAAARENLRILGHRIGSTVQFTPTEAGAIITEANRLISADA